MKKIFLIFTICFLFFSSVLYAGGLNKAPDDKSVSRNIVLDNGLKVLMISDPEYNTSAAALEIQVGSLMDPKDRQGLAHFLEHMLFLGTAKYPEVGDFSGFLDSHGGYSNAFTGEDRTNFHFEVQHDAFEGALDRFSQFFISPLFSQEYSEREMNAVNSEHQKNIQQDDWREHQLFKIFYTKDHPANHFATGNIDTLKGVKREEFIDFYNRYYSANRMSLVFLSSKSLDDMEGLAKKYFLSIKNNNISKPAFSPDYLDQEKAFRLIQRVPVKDIRELTLTFSLPGLIEYYKAKPEMIVGFCIGHEGEGSLLSYLKKQGLATGLSAGGGSLTDDYGRFVISIKLTQKGLDQYRDVVKYCFSYIDMLKEKGIQPYIFKEIKRIAELDYTYKNKGEGTALARHLAGNMNDYPADIADRVDYMYEVFEPELIRSVLDHLKPSNMLCMLTAKGLKTDKTEQYYGTSYSYSAEKGKFYKALKKPEKVKELFLPQPNPFIPQDADLLEERPVNIIDEPGLEIWYKQDVTFKRPKASIVFRVKVPKEIVSQAYMARLSLYSACVNDMLNEISYQAHEAGLDFSFSGDLDGMIITMSGYTGSMPMLLEKIGARLKTIDISDQRFSDIKEKKQLEWQNFKMKQAWEIARYVSRRIRKETYFSVDSILEESRNIGLMELKHFVDTLYSKTRIEGLAHGNISAEETESLSRKLKAYLNSAPLDKEETFKQRILVEKSNDPITYVERLETNNSCFWRSVYLGSETPQLRAASHIIENFISQPFYTEMRTHQQLGYIVLSAAPDDNGQHYLFFIIQSQSHAADDIRDRADRFIATLSEEFDALPEEVFNQFKAAVKTGLMEKPKSIAEKTALFDTLTFEYDKDFDRRQKDLDALEMLTKEQVGKILADALDAEKRKIIDILLFANQHEIKEETKASFDAIDIFKTDREFVERPSK